jgi:hypothetical protein
MTMTASGVCPAQTPKQDAVRAPTLCGDSGDTSAHTSRTQHPKIATRVEGHHEYLGMNPEDQFNSSKEHNFLYPLSKQSGTPYTCKNSRPQTERSQRKPVKRHTANTLNAEDKREHNPDDSNQDAPYSRRPVDSSYYTMVSFKGFYFTISITKHDH